MAIRKGIDNIRERNQEIAERSARSRIPELRLFDDGDVAIIRILTDEPLDVEFHEIWDPAISRGPLYFFCSDEGCEYCERGEKVVRVYMLWVWIEKILHKTPSETGTWKLTEVGNRKYYLEDMQQLAVIKRKFGRGQLWQQFENAYEGYGTLKDREYSFRRSGARGDINTTYTLTPLDKSPIPKHLIDTVNNLPSLELVAKGVLDSLENIQPKVVISIPDIEGEE